MSRNAKGILSVFSCSVTVIFPGALMLAYPGVMAIYWQKLFHVGEAPIGNVLFFMWLPVGLFMFLVGQLLRRYGTRIINTIGSLICGLNILIMANPSDMVSVYLWAALHGLGTCSVYNTALTAAQQWFPHRKGLISGLVNTAFGLSAALMVPLLGYLARSMDYVSMHVVLSVAIMVVGLAAGQFVMPPKGEAFSTIKGQEQLDQNKPQPPEFTVIEALKTRSFWLIWITWALQGAAGMSMLTLTTAYGLYRGFSLESAALILMAFNMTNGGSRIVTGILSDVLGSARVMAVSFFAAGVAYLFMPHVHSLLGTVTLAAIMGFAFGTLIAVTAPMVVDCFGLSHFGAIFGIVWSAFGFVSGLIGPSLCGYLLDVSGGKFTVVFSYLGLCSLISAIIIRFVRPRQASRD